MFWGFAFETISYSFEEFAKADQKIIISVYLSFFEVFELSGFETFLLNHFKAVRYH